MTMTDTPMTDFYAFSPAGPVRLTLGSEDVAAFNALPPLPLDPDADLPDEFVPPGVAVVDRVTGRAWWVARHPCGSHCGCAAWAQPLDE